MKCNQPPEDRYSTCQFSESQLLQFNIRQFLFLVAFQLWLNISLSIFWSPSYWSLSLRPLLWLMSTPLTLSAKRASDLCCWPEGPWEVTTPPSEEPVQRDIAHIAWHLLKLSSVKVKIFSQNLIYKPLSSRPVFDVVTFTRRQVVVPWKQRKSVIQNRPNWIVLPFV